MVSIGNSALVMCSIVIALLLALTTRHLVFGGETVFRASLWHPPKSSTTNNLTFALFGTGTDGKIYNVSSVPEYLYGVYNYCNMPHVRPNEYVVPEGYKLEYVEVIHRHHKRTPYRSNTFPKEDTSWDCGDTELYYYGQPVQVFDAAKVHRDIYEDPLNPFKPSGYTGNCDFPQLTKYGLNDALVHGKDLFATYGPFLKFLPESCNETFVSFRVTNNVITSQVAGAVIRGMYRDMGQIKVLQQRPEIDSLEPTYSCLYADQIMQRIRRDGGWTRHLELTQPIFDQLDTISGVNPRAEDWHFSFDHYFDALSSRMCHQKKLPCSLTDGSKCITQALADTVLRLGQYEYSYLYRSNPLSIEYARTHYGIFFLELRSRLKDDMGYRHNIAHDGSMSSVLSVLQVEDMVWPGMGAEVVFERWTKHGESCVRILWNGKVLESSKLGLVDMIPLADFLEYLDGVVGVDGAYVKEKCVL